MSPEKRREIARLGGSAVPAAKRSFSRDPDLAATAGKKGGSNLQSEHRALARDRQLASRAGRRGARGNGAKGEEL